MEEMESKDWSLLISEIPNISHFQQLYGFTDQKTINQLKEIKDLIENIINFVNNDNQTILFLISDSSDNKNRELLPNSSSFIMTFSSHKLSSIEV